MSDPVWDEIVRIMAEIKDRPKTDHLVDGFFLVTPTQYDALKKMGDDQAFEDMRRDMAGLPSRNNPLLGGVPVLVIYPDKPHDFPSGKVAIYRPDLIDAIVVFPQLPLSSAYEPPPTPEQARAARHAAFIPDYGSEGEY